MSKDVTTPEYWRERMYAAFASEERHRLMFNGSRDRFDEVEARQKDALRVIGRKQSVIDVGCGYGRLPDLFRLQGWQGQYIGYDVSPDLVAIARKWWPDYSFIVADLINDPPTPPFRADWAVALWVKTMLLGNGFPAEWDKIEVWMHQNANEVLIID